MSSDILNGNTRGEITTYACDCCPGIRYHNVAGQDLWQVATIHSTITHNGPTAYTGTELENDHGPLAPVHIRMTR